MAAIPTLEATSPRPIKRRWWIAGLVILFIPIALTLVSWWFTEPLVEKDSVNVNLPVVTHADPISPLIPSQAVWPQGKLEGREAKLVMVDILNDASRRIDEIQGYTATFKKQERIDGKLQPEQTLTMKVRQRPFAIYFKFITPHTGKEVVYAEGHHGNKVIAHNGDWTRRLVPRLAVEPTSAIALADSRHPVTEAGLSKLAHKLLAFRLLDLEDSDAETILDRVTGADGRSWLRSIHLHTVENPTRPFTRIEVLYDPNTLFPMEIRSYDWLKPGEKGQPPLAEHYQYENLAIDPPLTALDFDPANPSYEFQRF